MTRRDWMSVGADYTGPEHRPAVEAAIDALEWQPTTDGHIAGAFLPVMALRTLIEEFDLPRVSAFAVGRGALSYPNGPETAAYGLLGVQCTYPNGHVRLYVLDAGLFVVPLAADFAPTNIWQTSTEAAAR